MAREGASQMEHIIQIESALLPDKAMKSTSRDSLNNLISQIITLIAVRQSALRELIDDYSAVEP